MLLAYTNSARIFKESSDNFKILDVRLLIWQVTNLMFCWPCIVIYPYNMNQQDALFTFNLF